MIACMNLTANKHATYVTSRLHTYGLDQGFRAKRLNFP